MSTPMRMDAYYFSFTPTGCEAVDKVLSAVACAGKAYHHTEDWREQPGAWEPHTGDSPVEWIQNAANEAAAAMAQVAELRARAEAAEKLAADRLAELITLANSPQEDKIVRLEVELARARSMVIAEKSRADLAELQPQVETLRASRNAADARARAATEALRNALPYAESRAEDLDELATDLEGKLPRLRWLSERGAYDPKELRDAEAKAVDARASAIKAAAAVEAARPLVSVTPPPPPPTRANRFEQALSCVVAFKMAPGVVLVCENDSKWLIPARAWAGARDLMTGLPVHEDRSVAFAELLVKLRASIVASTAPAACRGPHASRLALVAMAVQHGLIDEATARKMSMADPGGAP